MNKQKQQFCPNCDEPLTEDELNKNECWWCKEPVAIKEVRELTNNSTKNEYDTEINDELYD
ncbi:MAG: hypothetical protein JSR11_07760 [Bacteroidetes bacterium]|nr:hypothetical protein [Bacteroidota bacterium]